jgi:hypothetical protein
MIEKAVALNSRLAVLLERKSGAMKGLERRLARLQSKRVKERNPDKPGESQETGA